ncbi:hypothetical protein EG240_15890 [Paenimyroides tangerinum]|uniref:Uncharacterized protein n=1 Tax=Paenimyroides tangerinum TaxID=2488728 RepID=A0A3P3VZ25_9FLAO|nr:hypothetical protein [Paenimyroides tangerinum]RRJ86689.1 hypothetical protein EG240_15890 [Paenimyroides tangerinum]
MPDNNYPSIKLKPLDPVAILSTENLDIVKIALDGINTNPTGMYIVPAIFLEYKTAKEFNDAVEKNIINTLDVVTIATSGGAALITKVGWVKRAWAITEVVGAVGSLVVTNTELKEKYPSIANTINGYNAVMGIIGLKNAALGLKNVAVSISNKVKNVILDGKKLNQAEDLVQAVADYKTEIATLKNSPEWNNLSSDVQQQLLKQEEFVDVLMEVKVVQRASKTLDDFVFWASNNGFSHLSRTELDDIFKFVDNNFDFAKRVANSTKEIQSASSLTELAGKLNLSTNPASKSLTPYETRVWYSWRKANIENMIDKTQTLESQAKQAVNMRNEIRSGARQAMKDSDIADYLDTKELNKTWEQLVQEKIDKGFIGNAIYEEIISSSMKGRPTVDNVFKIPLVK